MSLDRKLPELFQLQNHTVQELLKLTCDELLPQIHWPKQDGLLLVGVLTNTCHLH